MAKRSQESDGHSRQAEERVRRSKDAVLAAAYELLAEKGLSGTSVDEISARSGVAKTTIYRHWPNRSALLLDACSKLGPKPEVPDTGSLKRDLLTLTTFIATQLRSHRMASVMPSILDAAERDPQITDLHTRIQAGLVVPFETVFDQARRRGELPRGLNRSHLIATILGALFYRRWFSREPIDAPFVKAIVERALGSERGP